MTKTEKAIQWMEATAKDDSHGYCQQHRWGTDGDYDCSSAVITSPRFSPAPVDFVTDAVTSLNPHALNTGSISPV